MGSRYLAGSGPPPSAPMSGISLHTGARPARPLRPHPALGLAAATHGLQRSRTLAPLERIAPGYGADLVILDADPTVDIGNAKRIRTVVLQGREIERGRLLSQQD